MAHIRYSFSKHLASPCTLSTPSQHQKTFDDLYPRVCLFFLCKYVFDQSYKYVILAQLSSTFRSVYAKLRKVCSEWMSWSERFCMSGRAREGQKAAASGVNQSKWKMKNESVWKTGAMQQQQQHMNEVTRWDWIEYVQRINTSLHAYI